MPSQSEVGHAKNVAQFRLLIVHCEGFGAEYNPANAAISLAALQQILALAQTALEGVNLAKTNLNNATNAREVTFTALGGFGTRVVNALAAAGALPQTVADANTVLRKLRGGGKRKKPEITDADMPPETAPGQLLLTHRTVSVSQRSYDFQAEHFARLLQVVMAEPAYIPNEADLNIPALQAKLAALQAANLTVQQNLTAHENALIHRNTVLYAPGTGLVALAGDVKKYVKSVYGTASPRYKTVSSIAIRNIR